MGAKIINTCSFLDAKTFAKRGIPMDVRARMWQLLLVEEEDSEMVNNGIVI
jgi:hypothetical protein